MGSTVIRFFIFHFSFFTLSGAKLAKGELK